MCGVWDGRCRVDVMDKKRIRVRIQKKDMTGIAYADVLKHGCISFGGEDCYGA